MPNITTKSLSKLGELLDSENLAYKKCCNYVGDIEDEHLKANVGRYANNCKHRFETIFNYLENQE